MSDNKDMVHAPAAVELSEVERLRRSNEILEQKLLRAQGIIDDLKAEIPKSNKQTVCGLNRKLQITRDRLVAISRTTNVITNQTPQINENSSVRIALDNIQESVTIIADEMEQLGLWEHDHIKPEGIQDKR